jgi:hypothetical protein
VVFGSMLFGIFLHFFLIQYQIVLECMDNVSMGIMATGMSKTQDEDDDDGDAGGIKVKVCRLMMEEWLMNHVRERVS